MSQTILSIETTVERLDYMNLMDDFVEKNVRRTIIQQKVYLISLFFYKTEYIF